jgi:hypothetical protein
MSPRSRHTRLSDQLTGRTVARVSDLEDGILTLHFADGATLNIASGPSGLSATVAPPPPVPAVRASRLQPTKRQLEYLLFIRKYIGRFARSPAESDIQRHFLVAAPSVNHMIQALERRGFITRQPGVPRSICITFDFPNPSNGTSSS